MADRAGEPPSVTTYIELCVLCAQKREEAAGREGGSPASWDSAGREPRGSTRENRLMWHHPLVSVCCLKKRENRARANRLVWHRPYTVNETPLYFTPAVTSFHRQSLVLHVKGYQTVTLTFYNHPRERVNLPSFPHTITKPHTHSSQRRYILRLFCILTCVPASPRLARTSLSNMREAVVVVVVRRREGRHLLLRLGGWWCVLVVVTAALLLCVLVQSVGQ